MRRFTIALPIALLAACGSDEPEPGVSMGAGGEMTVTDGEGNRAVVNRNGTVNLPDGFSIYPGARVVSNTTVTQADGGGSMVIMESSASPDELAAHYRREAEAAGIRIAMEMNSNGTTMIGGEGEGGLAFSFTASPGEAGTTGMLTVGRQAP